MYNSSFTDTYPRPTPNHDASRPRLVKVVSKTRPRPAKMIFRPKAQAKRSGNIPVTAAKKVTRLNTRRSRYVLLRPGTAIAAQLTLIVPVMAWLVSII